MANIQQYIDQYIRSIGSKDQEKARHKSLLEKFISWEPQTLTVDQQLQARTNINIHSAVTLVVGSDPELTLSGQALNLNLSTLRQIKYNPTTLTVNTGTLTQGTVADLAAVGGTDVIIQEVTGSDPLRATLGFTGVNRLNSFNFFGRYIGGANHVVWIEAYDYAAEVWELIGEIGNMTSKGWFSFNLFLSERFISSGASQVRFNHQGTGIATHQLILDYVDVSWGGGGGSFNDHATLANLAWTNSNHSGTANYTPVFSATGTPALSPVQLTAAGSVNVPTGQTYQVDGTSLLLNHLLSGSIGAAGTIPVSAGAALAPVWTSVYGAIATTPTAGYLPKFGASRLENSGIYVLSGNVGIGTTAPGKLLEISSGAAPAFRIRNTGYTPNKVFDFSILDSGGLYLVDKDGDKVALFSESSGMALGRSYASGSYSPPANGMIIEGNVAIGTTDIDGTPPIGRLTIKGSTANGSTNIIVGRNSSEVNIYSLDTLGNATHSGYISATTAKLTTGATADYFWKCTNADGSGTWTAINQMVYPSAGTPISIAIYI